MAKATPETIVLRGYGIRKEAEAGVAITPGYLVERTVTTGFFKPHSTAATTHSRLFAVENEHAGSEITVDYAIGERALCDALVPGCEVYALVAASAAAIVIGDYLESAGDGTLRIQTAAVATPEAGRNSVVGTALEAVDNSGGGVEARIKVELV